MANVRSAYEQVVAQQRRTILRPPSHPDPMPAHGGQRIKVSPKPATRLPLSLLKSAQTPPPPGQLALLREVPFAGGRRESLDDL